MTTPIATEISRRLEPVAPDPFIDHLRGSALEVDARPHAASAATTARPRGRTGWTAAAGARSRLERRG